MSYQIIPVAVAVKAGIVDSDSRGAVWDDSTHVQGLRFFNDGQTILMVESSITATKSYATWSTDNAQAGDYSALLTKTDGDEGDRSTHLQIIPDPGLTFDDFATQTNEWSFYHVLTGDGTFNGPQFEFRFKDPDSDAWLEVTSVPLQATTSGSSTKETLQDADLCGFGGVTPDGTSVFSWPTLYALSGIKTAVNNAWSSAEVSEAATNYKLVRVRIELWEAAPARTAFIDTVVIDGDTYAVEPGLAGVKLGPNTPGVTLTFVAYRDRYGRTETLTPVVGAAQALIVGPLLPELFNDSDGYVRFEPDTTGLTVRYSAIRVANPS